MLFTPTGHAPELMGALHRFADVLTEKGTLPGRLVELVPMTAAAQPARYVLHVRGVELELGDDHEGLLILPTDLVPGTPLRETDAMMRRVQQAHADDEGVSVLFGVMITLGSSGPDSVVITGLSGEDIRHYYTVAAIFLANDPVPPRLYALLGDPSELLWVGSWRGGLWKANLHNTQFGVQHHSARTPLAELWRHPLHTREMGSQLTNVMRCLYLESQGYKVTVTELVGWEHSLKNELILAQYTGHKKHSANERLQALLAQHFGIDEPAVAGERRSHAPARPERAQRREREHRGEQHARGEPEVVEDELERVGPDARVGPEEDRPDRPQARKDKQDPDGDLRAEKLFEDGHPLVIA